MNKLEIHEAITNIDKKQSKTLSKQFWENWDTYAHYKYIHQFKMYKLNKLLIGDTLKIMSKILPRG